MEIKNVIQSLLRTRLVTFYQHPRSRHEIIIGQTGKRVLVLGSDQDILDFSEEVEKMKKGP